MIDPKLGYTQKTEDLINRMCKNVERKDFKLQKKKAAEQILKTYDLFKLPRPKKVKWCVDIFDKKFQDAAWSAWSARSAGSAGSAWSAWSARSAGSAGSAGSAWSAWSAWSAGSAGSAWSAWSAWYTALDYDFDYYIFEHEYCENPDEGFKPNENDNKYLKYCELLMKAKEFGCGYRLEYEDVLYLVPTPIVLLDEKVRYHSENKAAIRWKGGEEFFFLSGVSFEKKLWKRVTAKNVTLKTIFTLENMEQRMAALKLVGIEKLLDDKNATLLGKKTERGNELYLITDVFSTDAYFLKYTCPSAGRVYVSGIDPEIGEERDPDAAMAWKFNLTKSDYLALEIES